MVALCLGAGACGTTPGRSSGPPAQAPSAYRETVLADRPVGYWRLDETDGASAYDQSPAANHGAIEAVVALTQTGATPGDGNTAMLFNGNGRIFVPDSASLQIKGGAITLEAWVRPVAIQRGQTFILCKGRAGVQTEYCLVLMDGVPAYQSVVEHYVSTGDALPLGRWTHIAVTIVNNAAGTFYVNGIEAGTFAETTNHIITSSTHPVMVGAEADATSGWFTGAIDEVAVYDHALAAERLARHVASAAERAAGRTSDQLRSGLTRAARNTRPATKVSLHADGEARHRVSRPTRQLFGSAEELTQLGRRTRT